MILVIDNKSALRPEIEAWLKHVRYEIKSREEDWGNVDGYNLIVITGGHDVAVVNHEEFYKKELDLIRNFSNPHGRLVGICLGFELITCAYGSRLRHLAEREMGDLDISIIREDPIFKNIKTMRVFESHRWRVDSLSDELEILAQSVEGIETIRHKTKPIYGFQFHPEMIRDDQAGPILLSNLLRG